MKTTILLTVILLLTFPSDCFAKMRSIPLHKTDDGHLEIQASINNIEAKFILDTGATGTVIDIDKLTVFSIEKQSESIEGLRVGDEQVGRIETFPIEINEFSIGANQLNIKTMFANDMSGQFDSDVMGIIGYDALFELKALLYVKDSLLLVPETQESAQSWLVDLIIKQYEPIDLVNSAMGFNFIDAELNGTAVRLLVDTGAPQLILDESTLIQMGLKLESHPTAKTILAEGVELPMKVYKKGLVTVGNKSLTDDFFTTDFTALMNSVNVVGEPPLIGILGNKHLAQLNSIIDLGNAKIYIKDCILIGCIQKPLNSVAY